TPLAGLTAKEASERLAADPTLVDFEVKVILLRLEVFGDEALKPFGYDLFEGSPSTFAPVTDVPVPADYVVGPGDVLQIQLYGNEPASYSLAVNRDGRVDFPKLGPISVGGMSFERALATIESRVHRQLLGTRVSITMGDLRAIRVYVLGEAEKPGSYLVSGLSTMTNALFVSGGVKKIGSLRNIQLKRRGRLISELDLYDLLLRGDTSGDRQLMPGDVIFIPPVGHTAAVYGEVRRPAIYEFKAENSAGELIALAGGLMPEADPRTGSLEHISATSEKVTRNVDLSAEEGRRTNVGNGDKLRISRIRPTLENSVTLSGHVFRPNSFQYRPGLRISDVLPSFDELRPNADRHYIMIRRQVPPQQKLQVVSADLDRALAAPGSVADVALQPRDQVVVFDLSNDRERFVAPLIHDLELQGTMDRPAQVVSILGQVKAPGKYPLEPAMRVSDLIRAGGSLDDPAYGSEAELTRYQVVNGQQRQTELLKIDLAALRKGDTAADVVLQAFDSLVIKEIPDWSKPEVIEITGEVRYPGKYPVLRGETLHSLLERAGGLTNLGFAHGAVFTRKVLKEREKEQIELLSNRFQSDLTSLTLQSLAATVGPANNNTAGTAIAVGQELIQQLRDTKPIGRLVVDIDSVLKHPPGSEGDVMIKDGDKLMVPKKTQEITVIGEVQNPTSHVVEKGFSRDDYIAKSGGITAKADRKRIYVVHADGSVDSSDRRGWFRRGSSAHMQPGDTIVVPLDAERIRPLPLWTAVTTIIYNLAVAAAAVARF
ncbi:MAG: SLBB domain-containing protein, partial [Proteobacteria bacterium]|nr:SLBB domain-containing protein [Pseudomonadota bacterium]